MSKPLKKSRIAKSRNRLDMLPADVRRDLDAWLFEDNWEYDEILEELAARGHYISRGSLSNYRRKHGVAKLLADASDEHRRLAEALTAQGVDCSADGVSRALLTVSRQRLTAQLLIDPDRDTYTVLTQERQADERLAYLKDELQLKKHRWEFSAAEAALAALDDLLVIKNATDTDVAGKIERVRKRLFGDAPPTTPL